MKQSEKNAQNFFRFPPPPSTTLPQLSHLLLLRQNVSREEHPWDGQPAPRHQRRGRRRLPGKVRGEKEERFFHSAPPHRIDRFFLSFARGVQRPIRSAYEAFSFFFLIPSNHVAFKLASAHDKKAINAAQGPGRASIFSSPFKVLPPLSQRSNAHLFFPTPLFFHTQTNSETDQDGRPDPRRGQARPDVQGEKLYF